MSGIVIFAMIAVFLGLRLYAVLGRRTGHEQSRVPLVEDVVKSAKPVVVQTGSAAAPKDLSTFDAQVASGLKAISSADSSFDPVRFIDGARSAYKMILEAYWKGDETALAEATSDDVRKSFGEAIAARTEAGHVLDNRLVTIERSTITKAWIPPRPRIDTLSAVGCA